MPITEKRKQFFAKLRAKYRAKYPGEQGFDLESFMNSWQDEHPDSSNIGYFYDRCAGNVAYIDFITLVGYICPFLVAQVISKPLREDADQKDEFDIGFLNAPRDCKVFDFCSGTGLLGELLYEQGFTHIIGADASSKSNAIAERTGYYKDVREQWFGLGVDKLPKEWLNSFDVVMAAGVFSQGHVPPAGIDDALAICKPGGHFVHVIRKRIFEGENNDQLGF